MGQGDVNENVKGQNLSRMNCIVKRIESELNILKNLINEQIHGLTTASPSPSTNCDGDSDGSCDTKISIIYEESYCPMDTIKIEDGPPIDTTAEDVDKVSNSNSNYQFNEFNNDIEDEDQGIDCQNTDRPSNEDELILGRLDFNCEISSKDDETHVDPPQSSYFSSFQNQEKVFINQQLVDLKPADLVDLIQISNENQLEETFEVAGKNDKKLSQKSTVQMGVRCDQNPRILTSYRAKISPRQGITENAQKNAKKDAKDFLSKSKQKSGKNSKICSFCSKFFRDFYALAIHMRVHTGERSFKCKICSKSFTTMGHLKRHNLIHTGEKPYSCSICSKKFTQIQHRNSHMRTHTDERPFSCTFCSKKFAHLQSRDSHIRTHTGEKPFSCGLCSKKFAQISTRDAHIRTHTGERPFSCSVCSKTFANSSNLRIHKKLHSIS